MPIKIKLPIELFPLDSSFRTTLNRLAAGSISQKRQWELTKDYEEAEDETSQANVLFYTFGLATHERRSGIIPDNVEARQWVGSRFGVWSKGPE